MNISSFLGGINDIFKSNENLREDRFRAFQKLHEEYVLTLHPVLAKQIGSPIKVAQIADGENLKGALDFLPSDLIWWENEYRTNPLMIMKPVEEIVAVFNQAIMDHLSKSAFVMTKEDNKAMVDLYRKYVSS